MWRHFLDKCIHIENNSPGFKEHIYLHKHNNSYKTKQTFCCQNYTKLKEKSKLDIYKNYQVSHANLCKVLFIISEDW